MDECLDLPPGFRFHPTDEEIITHYLSPKILNHGFSARAIAEVDLNKCEPWDLPSMANMGEKEWYFFCQRDRKYPTGTRTNRATESGYWKATGKDKEIFKGGGVLVGMKKTLVFYRGRAPKGFKTNWVMHEYRLEGKAHLSNLPKSSKNEWVVCRVFHKNPGLKKSSPPMLGGDLVRMNSFTDELMDPHTLPPLMEPSYFNSGYEDSFDVKEIMTNSAPMSYYLSAMMDGNDDSLDRFNSRQTTTPDSCNPHHMSSSCLPDFQTRNDSYLSVAGGAEMGGGLRTNFDAPSAMRRHCKPDQFSNQSMMSQETGVSTDRNTEISSVISKRDIASCASYGHLDLPPADGGGVMDLANMWRC